jgi:hypothetical protein
VPGTPRTVTLPVGRVGRRESGTEAPERWPDWLNSVWGQLDKVHQAKLRGPWDDPNLDHQAHTDACMRMLRHHRLTLPQMIEAATFFPDGFGKLRDYPGGLGKLIGDLWQKQDADRAKAEQAKRQVGNLRILSVDDLLSMPPRDYLVKGWLSPNEISLMVGTKNTRKTFNALHAGYAVSQKRRVFGRRVKQTSVLYTVAEGEQGIGKRVTALARRYGKSVHFRIIAQPIDLLRSTASEGDLHDLIEAARIHQCGLIIIDTVSRAMNGGNENGPEDMGTLLGNLNILRHATRAHIMGVHHGSQAEGTKSRGHSSLPFGVDVIAQVEWSDVTNSGTINLGFCRDDATGILGGFRTELVEGQGRRRGRDHHAADRGDRACRRAAEAAGRARDDRQTSRLPDARTEHDCGVRGTHPAGTGDADRDRDATIASAGGADRGQLVRRGPAFAGLKSWGTRKRWLHRREQCAHCLEKTRFFGIQPLFRVAAVSASFCSFSPAFRSFSDLPKSWLLLLQLFPPFRGKAQKRKSCGVRSHPLAQLIAMSPTCCCEWRFYL